MSRYRRELNQKSPLGMMSWIFILSVLGSVVWYVLQRSPEVAPGRVQLARLSARNVQEAVAFNGISGGATAGQREIAAARNSVPTDRTMVKVSASTAYGMAALPDGGIAASEANAPAPAIRITGIMSEKPYRDPADAMSDALTQARDRLTDVFASLQSPIRAVPTEEELLRDYVESNSIRDKKPTDEEKAAWRAGGLGEEERVWKVLSVSVSEEQLRQLRARQRLQDLSRWTGVALAIMAIAYGVLRAEDRSQGYFSWLWAGAGLILSAAVIGLAFLL